MSVYNIKDYSFKQADKLGVQIRPSTNKKKKIDVFKNGQKLAEIGAIGYGDYPHYLDTNKQLAKIKRVGYKARHEKDRKVKGSAGYFADKILW
jgi:hypothetical protein